MAATDPFTDFKAAQRETWPVFAPLAEFTTPPAAALVRFAGIRAGESVLDVACGTGVVAVTAARSGARVRGLDLTPQLLEIARENAALAEVEIELTEGDAEALPYGDAELDVVVSQFGHMFAPRPEVATAEMLRVLKPGGRIAFSTWPPEHYTGQMFALLARYLPPPEGVAPTPLWGDPNVVRERLGDAVTDLRFDRGTMLRPALSPRHFRHAAEAAGGPIVRVRRSLADDPERLKRFDGELEAVIAPYFADNTVTQHYLMTRAVKR